MIGIVFYSKDGSTRVFSNILEGKLNAISLELVEKKKRLPIIGFISGGYQAISHKETKLLNTSFDTIKDWDTIYLCTPVWADNGTPAINTFLNHVDLTGKKVVIVTVMADPKLACEKCHKYLFDFVLRKGGEVISKFAFRGASPGKTVAIDDALKQIENSGICDKV